MVVDRFKEARVQSEAFKKLISLRVQGPSAPAMPSDAYLPMLIIGRCATIFKSRSVDMLDI